MAFQGSTVLSPKYVVTQADEPTANLVEGLLWYDTTAEVLKTYNGSAFVSVGAVPDNESLELDGDGKMTIKASALIETASSPAEVSTSSTSIAYKDVAVTIPYDSIITGVKVSFDHKQGVGTCQYSVIDTEGTSIYPETSKGSPLNTWEDLTINKTVLINKSATDTYTVRIGYRTISGSQTAYVRNADIFVYYQKV